MLIDFFLKLLGKQKYISCVHFEEQWYHCMYHIKAFVYEIWKQIVTILLNIDLLKS